MAKRLTDDTPVGVAKFDEMATLVQRMAFSTAPGLPSSGDGTWNGASSHGAMCAQTGSPSRVGGSDDDRAHGVLCSTQRLSQGLQYSATKGARLSRAMLAEHTCYCLAANKPTSESASVSGRITPYKDRADVRP